MAIETVPIKTKIDGKQITVDIATDIKWGEFKKIIKAATAKGDLDLDIFIDRLVANCISSKEYDFKNSAQVENLTASEMSFITGKMLDILPLETYMKNLGGDKGENLDKLSKLQKT